MNILDIIVFYANTHKSPLQGGSKSYSTVYLASPDVTAFCLWIFEQIDAFRRQSKKSQWRGLPFHLRGRDGKGPVLPWLCAAVPLLTIHGHSLAQSPPAKSTLDSCKHNTRAGVP